MAKTNNLTDFLTDLADTIRTKKGTSGAINPQDFSSEIASIPTGTDVSDTTATASDVLSGKDFYLSNGTKASGTIQTYSGTTNVTQNGTLATNGKYLNSDIVVNVASTPIEKFELKVLDYDGTIIDEVELANGETYTLPTPPTHTGLVFEEWISTETITNNVVTCDNADILIGTLYHTASGLCEFDIEITKANEPDIVNNGFTVTFNTSSTKDWGDGTTDTSKTHTYYAYGAYTIKTGFSGYITSYLFSTNYTICSTLKEVRLSENCTGFNSNAFYYCKALKAVAISRNVTSIAYHSFYACGNLKTFFIKDTTTIGAESFMYSGLEYLILNKAIPVSVNNIFQYTKLEKLIIKNDILGSGIFSNTGAIIGTIKRVFIKGNVNISSAISMIYAEKIVINGNVTFSQMLYNLMKKIELIGNSTLTNTLSGNYPIFRDCFLLEKLKLSAIGYIGDYCFTNCYNLKEIEFGTTSITIIGTNAFQNCHLLEELILPNSITTINNNAFNNCFNLKYIKFSQNLTTITNTTGGTSGTFLNTGNLKILDFSECQQIPSISSINTLNYGARPSTFKIVVPDSLYDSWIATTNWVSIKNFIYKASEVNIQQELS